MLTAYKTILKKIIKAMQVFTPLGGIRDGRNVARLDVQWRTDDTKYSSDLSLKST